MLKIYFLIFVSTISFHSNSQTTIAKQSFEISGDTWQPIIFSTAPCSIEDDSWNYHSSLETIFPSEGNQFWGIRDLNGNCGSSNFEFISLPNTNISGFKNTILSFDYNVFEFDNGDDIKYELFFDDISQGEIIITEGSSNFSTDGWQTETVNIPNIVNLVRIFISIKQNGANDYAGIDNIKLQGEEIIPCTELIISEYIEGTSSGSHRNNFIEIYNPTNQIIDLENYNLTKFTNDNLNSTGNVPLSGTISAYGTYLVEDGNENIGITANLSTSSSVLDFNGNDKIALRKHETIIDLIGIIGNNIDFAKDVTFRRKSHVQSPNNEYNENEWDIYGLEDITNINSHVSNCIGAIPEIEIFGNLNEIRDGSLNSSFTNNTFFGNITASPVNTITKTFTIKNTGTDILEIYTIEIIGANASEFSLGNISIPIINPNNSIEFQIDFNPTSKGIKLATVNITNNDASENPFNFIIQGEGTGTSNGSLMITQYYEGSGNNKWLEITNISDTTTPENTYYLALFRNLDSESPIGINPTVKKLIPILNSGETLKYSASLNVDSPAYAIDGNEIKTNICTFDGNDIIIISTTDNETCWENKIDIIGNSTNWGQEKSLVRKYGCEKSEPKTGFDINDWLVYEVSEINSAIAGFNLRIGEHYFGSTIFETNNIWNNGFPDKYREAFIDSDFNTFSHGNIEVCNLTINNNKTLSINNDNYISIINDLLVKGTLNVLHEGSLVMTNDNGLVTNNGIINIHKTTTPFKQYDYTYWSSPIKNANLENVFEDSPQNSFFKFETQNFSDLNNDSYDDDENAWQQINGAMESGIGYTAMAPNTNPFINTQSVIFTGEVNNGIIKVPVYLSEDNLNEDDDWNLIGNPYPSAIDAELFLNYNTILNGSIYFWTHNTSANSNEDNKKYSSDDYAMFTVGTGGIMANSKGQIPTGFIASGQGFFVEAIQQGELEFNNSIRVKTGNNNFFKSKSTKNDEAIQKDKIWLNLYNEQGAFSQLLIGFIEGASESYEFAYDGLRFEGNNFISFYSITENQHLAIQGTFPFKGDEIIPLGFSTAIEEKIILKIGIDHLEGKLKTKDIFLYDRLLQKTHNLQIDDYEFSIEKKGNFNNRFSLNFNNTVLGLDEVDNINEKLIIKNEVESLIIKTTKNSTISSIRVFDILGRSIKQIDVNNKEVLINNNNFNTSGIFIIYVRLNNSKILIQKIIK